MNEAIRNLIYNKSQAERGEHVPALYPYGLESFNPYLETRATSEERQDRAMRLIHASRIREEGWK